MKHISYYFAAIIINLILIFNTVKAQTITVFDTVYTPIGNPDGSWIGTMFAPSNGNGIGVLVLHGYGSMRQTNLIWCDTLAARGYTVFTIEYPVYPTYKFPKPQRAIKQAVEFLRKNGPSFGITTGKIAGLGFSYGSIILGQTIIWDNDDLFFQTDPNIDDHFDAVTLFYGLYDYEHYVFDNRWNDFDNDSLYQKGSCIKHVSNITSPVLLLHGTGDQVINYMQSKELNDSLLFYGKVSHLFLVENYDHGFDLNWPAVTAFTTPGLQAKDAMLAFLNDKITGIGQISESSIPKGFLLEQNYPNPFNPSTVIKYSIPFESNVNIRFYNSLGQTVREVNEGNRQPGNYEINFNSPGLASGIYFYSIRAVSENGKNEFSAVKKMMLIK